MKNAEELFSNKSDCYADTGFYNDGEYVEGEVIEAMMEGKFIEALNDHDNELISEIEKKIESSKELSFNLMMATKKQSVRREIEMYWDGYENSLTEIINLIKEK